MPYTARESEGINPRVLGHHSPAAAFLQDTTSGGAWRLERPSALEPISPVREERPRWSLFWWAELGHYVSDCGRKCGQLSRRPGTNYKVVLTVEKGTLGFFDSVKSGECVTVGGSTNW